MRPNWILIGAALGATFVLHAAFGAHWLETRADAEQLEWWGTGAFHHGVHALALLAFGLFIFSTTLYAMALGGPRWLGAVTPIGGTLLVLGWAGFALCARGARE